MKSEAGCSMVGMLACTTALLMIGSLPDQTFINDGVVLEAMLYSLGAIKAVVGERVYLNAEHVFFGENGLVLVCKNEQKITLPKIYSDQYGCYLKRISHEYDGL